MNGITTAERPVLASTPARPAPLLEATGLEVSYGAIRALRGVGLQVGAGETVAVIGANGAGKSTLMRTLSGLLRPTAGTARMSARPAAPKGARTAAAGEGTRVHTLDLCKSEPHTIAQAGLLHIPEGRGTLGRLTVEDNLRLAFDRDPAARARESFEVACERVFARFPRLKERLRQAAGSMSGGEQQQLALARPLLARPQVLMLDEPSLGLSPVMVSTVFGLLRELRDEGMTILIVEQNARAALRLAHHAYVLKQGRIVHEGAAASLLADDSVLSHYLGA